MRFGPDAFADLIDQAIQSLPDQFRERMENVSVHVEPLADRRTCREMDLSSPYDLFGLYRGVPLTERSVEAPYAWPDRIVIYQKPIERTCDSAEEAVEQIRRTVLHEIGHFFGLDEDDLEELGYD